MKAEATPLRPGGWSFAGEAKALKVVLIELLINKLDDLLIAEAGAGELIHLAHVVHPAADEAPVILATEEVVSLEMIAGD